MSKTIKDTATCADTICLSVLNPDSTPGNQPVFYIGKVAALDIQLVNATGNDIALQSGVKLDIFFLSLNVDLAACKINLPGWTLTPGQYSLSLEYSGNSPATWEQGADNALVFQITGVQSSLTQAMPGFVQINFLGMSGPNIPRRLKTPIGLIAAPQPGNADLDLSVQLGDDGVIYVSQSGGSMITNRLLLNIANNSPQPLFSGTPGQEGSPTINVSFVYGATPGSLAEDADKSAPQTGSAWNIKSKVSAGNGNDWAVTNPDPTTWAEEDPFWVSQPQQTNHQLIGTKDAAAIQFEFDNIISQTQPGVTMMYVQFSGFKKDDHTLYNDRVFVLQISKEYLPTPGLIRFYSETSQTTIHSSSQAASFQLKWIMTGVSKINLQVQSDDITGLNIKDVCIQFPSPQPPLQFGEYLLEIPGVPYAGSLQITCTAYDDPNDCTHPLPPPDSSLGSLEFGVNIDFPPVVTAYSGDIQADGSLLLQWQTEGVTSVKITCFPSPFNTNGQTKVSSPQRPLLNNPYYALTAVGPNQTSEPTPFQFSKKFVLSGSTIPVGKTPAGMAASANADFVFVVNSGDNTISVIDLRSGPPFQSLQPAIAVGDRPNYLFISPKGDHLFVLYQEQGIVSVIDLRSGPPFELPAQVINLAYDGAVNDIVFSPAGDYAFVNDGYSLFMIDLTSQPPLPVFSAFGQGLQSMVVSPKGDYVFATQNGLNTVSVLAIGSTPPLQMSEPIQLGTQPGGLAVSPNGDYIFVTSQQNNTVTVIDLKSGPPFQVLSSVQIGMQFSGLVVSPTGDYVFVTGQKDNTVSVIDLRSSPPFQVLSPAISLGAARPVSNFQIAPKGDYIFVNTNDRDSYGEAVSLSVIEIGSNPPFKVTSFDFSASGYWSPGTVFTPNGDFAFVGILNNESLQAINIASPLPLKPLSLPISFTNTEGVWVYFNMVFCPSGDYAFIANFLDNSVTALTLVSVGAFDS